MENNSHRLILNLAHPRAYTHTVDSINIVETHISWVILTGKYAYKIKKPVDLGFLDFSTLEKRHHYCLEELRLNRRLEPEIYLDVVAITGTYDTPSMDGEGSVLEWAVKMRQFDPTLQFNRLLEKKLLRQEHIESLAKRIIAFHAILPGSDSATKHGDAESVHAPIHDNYLQADRYTDSAVIKDRLHLLQNWHEQQYIKHKSLLNKRKYTGFVRGCHGDLHLANIALENNKVIIFDCLEFNDNLRYIDVINEISFLLMDLEAQKSPDLANYFLNYWLQVTGDFEGLQLLSYYKAYRSMVRAKVAIIEATQKTGIEKTGARERADLYLTLTRHYTSRTQCAIILTHGLSGSGKSTISRQLASHINAIYVRSDIERKRLFNDKKTDIYSEHSSQITYNKLEKISADIISAGYNALVDATFLAQNTRQKYIALADNLGIPCIILDFFAPRELLEKWLIERAESGNDASDANIEILNKQIIAQDPLTTYENSISIYLDTSRPIDIPSLANRIRIKISALA
jgi:hypothetical protein